MKQESRKAPKRQLTLKDYIRYIPEVKTLHHRYKNPKSYITAFPLERQLPCA
jgi:hypothetical protein